MYMTTTFVGIKDFRKDVTGYAKKAHQKDTQIIITHRQVPLFKLEPITEDDEDLYLTPKLLVELKKAREEILNGEYVTHEEIMKEFCS